MSLTFALNYSKYYNVSITKGTFNKLWLNLLKAKTLIIAYGSVPYVTNTILLNQALN